MGDRLTKEIRLEVNAVPGSVTGFTAATEQLDKIMAKIKELHTLAKTALTIPITLDKTGLADAQQDIAALRAEARRVIGLPAEQPMVGGVGGAGTPPLVPPLPGAGRQPSDARQTMDQWQDVNRVIEQNKTNLQALEAGGYKPLGATIKQTSRGVASISQQFQTLDGRTARINYTTGEFTQQMQAGTKATKAMGDTIGHTVGKVALWTVSTGIIYGSLRAMVSLKEEMIAVDYQSGRLQRVFAGTAEEFGKLKDEAIDLGVAMGIVPSQAIETAVSVARLQQDRVRTLEMLRVALLAQSVAELTVEESLKFTTSAILQFNMSSMQAIQVLNQWNELSNKNRVLTRDLGDAVSVAGKAFFEAGASIETLNAYTTVLVQTMGKTGAEIGTALRTIAIYAQDVRKAGNVSDITGQQIYDLGENVKPIGQIIAELAVKFDSLTDAQRNNVAQQIAGIRRRTQLLVLLREYPAVLTALTQQFEQENSALEEQAVVSRTLQFQTAQLSAEFGKLGVAAGDAGLAGFMRGTVMASKLVVTAFNDNNVVGRVLIGAIQVLAARFLILHGINMLTTNSFKTLAAAVWAGASAMSAATAAATKLAVATTLAWRAVKGIGIAVGVGVALLVVTELLGKLFNVIMGSLEAPKALSETLQSIQALANEAQRLKSVAQNARDVAHAMLELNKIEAAGGKLTDKQEELKQAVIAYFVAMEKGIRSEEEVIRLLTTEVGLKQILVDLESRHAAAAKDVRAAENTEIREQQKKILDLKEEIRSEEERGDPTAGYFRGESFTPSPNTAYLASLRDEILTHQAAVDQILKDRRERESEAALAHADKLSKAQIAAHRKMVQERIQINAQLAARDIRFDSVFAVGAVEKANIKLLYTRALIRDLVYQKQKLESTKMHGTLIMTDTMITEMEEVENALDKLVGVTEPGDELEVRISISTERIKEDLDKLKSEFDFKTSVIDIISEDSLEAVARKYALITQEVQRLRMELENATRIGLSDEDVLSRRLRLVELEKSSEQHMNDLRLEQLRIMVDMTREMEKQGQNAERNFLFADRETQARAAYAALALQKRGGERLSAVEFMQHSPEVRRIMADMVPGLLPVEALSAQMQKAMGVTPSPMGIGRFLQLGPEDRREVEQTFPTMIPEINVPADRFKFPDEIIVTADRIKLGNVGVIEFESPKNHGAASDAMPRADWVTALSSTLKNFTSEQDRLTQQWADAFSKQKQSGVEMDVDVNFAGVQGPLNNLVSTFTTIVERRLGEKIDELEARLATVTARPSRPNVNAEAI